jgi:hypothetical protein
MGLVKEFAYGPERTNCNPTLGLTNGCWEREISPQDKRAKV